MASEQLLVFMSNKTDKPFWEYKSLKEMSTGEWESLCDGCGLCCLVRIEDENTGDVYDTNVICAHYDCSARGCSSYQSRTRLSDGCVQLTPALVDQFDWLPDSCAYRRHARGLPLLDDHPLRKRALDQNTSDASSEGEQLVNVVDLYEPVGLIVNGPDVVPEQHLVFPDELTDQDD